MGARAMGRGWWGIVVGGTLEAGEGAFYGKSRKEVGKTQKAGINQKAETRFITRSRQQESNPQPPDYKLGGTVKAPDTRCKM